MASTDQQLASAKRKAWVVLKAHNSIWQSSVGREYKRQLCYALVEPILTYSAKSWPLTAAQERRLDDALLGHMTREHVAGVRFHPLVTVLLWDFSSCKQKRHVKTLREQVFHESRPA